jgi:hypothetical protein
MKIHDHVATISGATQYDPHTGSWNIYSTTQGCGVAELNQRHLHPEHN